MTNAAYHQGFRDGQACGPNAELERLRAIESDRDDLLAWIRRLEPRPAYESTLCPMCLQPIKRYWQEGAPHLPGCPWLRATQEVQP